MAPVDVHRVVVLGAGQVGKTALINRFITGEFEHNYLPTLEDLHKDVYMADGKAFHMEILDTSGSHEFPAMRQLGIQSGRGFIIVYALNKPDSFKDAIELVKHVREEKGEDVPVCLCGNKTDLGVSSRSFSEHAPLKSVMQLEVSAKENYNVETVFLTMFNEMVTNTVGNTEGPVTREDKRKDSLRDKLKRRLTLIRKDKSPTRRHSDGEALNEKNDEDITPMQRPRFQTFSGFRSLLKIKSHHSPPEALKPNVTAHRRQSIANPESTNDTRNVPEFITSSRQRRHSTCPIPTPWEPELNEESKDSLEIENRDNRRVKTFVEREFDSPETTRACRKGVIGLNQSGELVGGDLHISKTECGKYSAPDRLSSSSDLTSTSNPKLISRRRRSSVGQPEPERACT